MVQDHLDKRLERYRRHTVIRDVGYRVTNGLPKADARIIAENARREPIADARKGISRQAAAASKAARLILERAVLVPVSGTATPSAAQLAELWELGEALTMLETARAIAELSERDTQQPSTTPHLGEVRLEPTKQGIEVEYRPGDFDLERWVELHDRPFSEAEIDWTLLPVGGEIGGEGSALQEISRASVQELGFSPNDLMDVLALAIRLCLDHGFEFMGFDGRPFGEQVSSAAVDYLTFSEDHVTLNDLRPSATRHQRRRVWTSPLIRTGDRYFLHRDLIFEASIRWARYLTVGDWPVPRNALRDTAPLLWRALEDRSQASGATFEKYVAQRLDETGLPHTSLKNNARIGATKLSREIDSVVVNTEQRTLHVLEFKNHRSDQNARSLQSDLAKFLGSYAEKLERSVKEIEAEKAATVAKVSELTGIPLDHVTDPTEWSVEAAFVFSSHSPIECLTTPRFFSGINADDVRELFGPRDPTLGDR